MLDTDQAGKISLPEPGLLSCFSQQRWILQVVCDVFVMVRRCHSFLRSFDPGGFLGRGHGSRSFHWYLPTLWLVRSTDPVGSGSALTFSFHHRANESNCSWFRPRRPM